MCTALASDPHSHADRGAATLLRGDLAMAGLTDAAQVPVARVGLGADDVVYLAGPAEAAVEL